MLNLLKHINSKKNLFLLLLLLVVGVQAQDFYIHKVEKGQTLLDIAKIYKIPPSDILRYNADISSSGKLQEGHSVLIPNKKLLNQGVIKDSIRLTGKIIDYKYHTVDENETLFSLSKKYHSNIESIVELNQVEGFDIKLGQILIIPILEDENAIKQIDETKYTYYEVKPKQGKWRVAYDHGITIDELERLNPEIKNETLKVGQKLIVPKFVVVKTEERDEKKYIYHDVQPKETLFSLSKKYNITIDDLLKYNPELKDGLKFGQVIKIPREINPDDFSTTNQLTDFDKKIKTLTIQDSLTSKSSSSFEINLLDSLQLNRSYKIAILLPFKLKNIEDIQEVQKCKQLIDNKILDYYSGIKFAIDSLKSLGLQVDYDVFDTQASPYVTGKILEVTDLSDYNFVIGPVKHENIEKTAQYLEYDNTPIVVHRYKGDKQFRNIIVTSSTNNALFVHMLNFLKENSEGKTVNLVYDPSEKSFADTLSVKLNNNVVKIEGKKNKKGFSISVQDIVRKLDPHTENYVILLSKDDSFIFSVLSTLNSLRNKYKITLFTFEDLKLYEDDTNDRMNIFLANLNYHFPSKMIRKLDQQFVKKYKEKYHVLPSFTTVNGFDTTFDLLVRAANADNLFEGLQKIGRTLQSSKVYLYKHRPETGFQNVGSIILQINKHLDLEKIE